jgi:hypothetical protein
MTNHLDIEEQVTKVYSVTEPEYATLLKVTDNGADLSIKIGTSTINTNELTASQIEWLGLALVEVAQAAQKDEEAKG